MTDKFTQLADARAEFARLWDTPFDEIAESEESWANFWQTFKVAGDKALALLGYTTHNPTHYRGCLPSSHKDYVAYTQEDLP